MFTCVFLLDVRIDREVVAVLRNRRIANQRTEVLHVLTIGVKTKDAGDILFRQFILVPLMDKLIRGIDKQHFVVRLVLADDDDTGSNRHAEEKVSRQLDNRIHIIVVNQILAYFLFCSATIKHARELNDSCSSIGC